MNTFKDKTYANYDYTCRYTSTPYFFDTKNNKEVYGVGTSMDTTSPYYSHQVKAGDTLDSLSLKYYNNPTYWWVIARFNKIQDAFCPLKENTLIKIPHISSIQFGADR